MGRPACLLVLVLALAASVLAPAAGAFPTEPGRLAGAPAGKVLKTAGPVIDLAADGRQVAAGVRWTRRACDRVVVWNVVAGTTTARAATTNCPGGDVTSGGERLAEVAIAGSRVAWIEIALGNHQFIDLFTARLAGGKRTFVTEAENSAGAVDRPDGDYLGGLHGDGSVLAYGFWSLCVAYPPGSVVEPPPAPPCDLMQAPGDEPVEVVYEERLFRIGRSSPLRVGPAALQVVSVDAGRILTHQRTGSLTIVGQDGSILQTVLTPAGEIEGAALSGDEVAVLRGGTIEVYDAVTGAAAGTVPLGPGFARARLTDLKEGVAVVLAGGKVHLVRLADGARASIAVPGSGPVDAELEASGLAYAYNVVNAARRGRVAFLPASEVEALLP